MDKRQKSLLLLNVTIRAFLCVGVFLGITFLVFKVRERNLSPSLLVTETKDSEPHYFEEISKKQSLTLIPTKSIQLSQDSTEIPDENSATLTTTISPKNELQTDDELMETYSFIVSKQINTTERHSMEMENQNVATRVQPVEMENQNVATRIQPMEMDNQNVTTETQLGDMENQNEAMGIQAMVNDLHNKVRTLFGSVTRYVFLNSVLDNWTNVMAMLHEQSIDGSNQRVIVNWDQRFATDNLRLGFGVRHRIGDNLFLDSQAHYSPNSSFISQFDFDNKLEYSVGSQLYGVRGRFLNYSSLQIQYFGGVFTHYFSDSSWMTFSAGVSSSTGNSELSYSATAVQGIVENVSVRVDHSVFAEFDQGSVDNVTATFGGITYQLSDDVRFDAGYTVEERQNGPRREYLSLSAGVRLGF